ncbi:hypothetical protein [Paenibacillus alvei]|uniref:hypothetical protein n=1 Tax=Paenibacillus alvei TaxID=44250 RepID=UPI0010FDA476|nr:hypothetical protein [Paenibacillus alvei]
MSLAFEFPNVTLPAEKGNLNHECKKKRLISIAIAAIMAVSVPVWLKEGEFTSIDAPIKRGETARMMGAGTRQGTGKVSQ